MCGSTDGRGADDGPGGKLRNGGVCASGFHDDCVAGVFASEDSADSAAEWELGGHICVAEIPTFSFDTGTLPGEMNLSNYAQ